MTISFAASRSFLSIRLGRFEVFAQRESVPATRYGITPDPISGGTLDLPGMSISWASRGYCCKHKER
jgi:hypothetical protein